MRSEPRYATLDVEEAATLLRGWYETAVGSELVAVARDPIISGIE